MPGTLRRLALIAFALVVTAYAWQALLFVEPFGRDWPVLSALAANASSWFGAAHTLDPDGGHPLAVLSLASSARLFTHADAAPLLAIAALRAENWAIFLCAVLAFAVFVRRFFWPWTGVDQARAAGWSAALFVAVNPLFFPLVASVAYRGELLALAFAALAGALFLVGRQEGRYALTASAACAAALAGASSDLAFFLPPALAIGEYVSARRHRPRPVRLRTTLTTLVVFGACVGVSVLLRFAIDDRLAAPAFVSDFVRLLRDGQSLTLATIALEKLGLVVVPINAWTLGPFGQAIACALLLVAIQPGLLAARTAPRLWSALLATLSLMLVVALLLNPVESASSRSLAHVDALCVPVIVLCAGLGAAATALSGARRWITPCAIAAGSAFLAHANAVPWVRASQELAWLRSDLASARVTYGRDANLLVIDPPGPTLGVDVVGGALEHLVDRVLDGDLHESRGVVRGLDRRALGVLVRTSELRELARPSLVVLERDDSMAQKSSDASFAAFENRRARELAFGAQSKGPRSWSDNGKSPALELAPIENLALRVRAKPDAVADKAPRLGWRRGEDSSECDGVWTHPGGEPVAVFDLGASLDWLASGRVTRLWSAQGWPDMIQAEVLADLPALDSKDGAPLAPRVDGSAWIFDLAPPPLAPAELARARWRFTWLELDRLSSRIESGTLDASNLVRVPRAVAVRSKNSVWALEILLDEVAIARAGGRSP